MTVTTPPPVCRVTTSGIVKPDFSAVLEWTKAQFRAIYGADIYIDPDSQDGQFLSLFSVALDECNAMAVSVFNAFSPATAQGEGLSRVVKINGIARKVATFSTVELTCVGQVGTIISNGVAADDSGNTWNLPATVVIPETGEVTVSATCSVLGAVQAAQNTITTITTVTRGWQSVTNPLAATPGAPVETDATLRLRQALSTSIPSQSLFEGTWGAISALSGVTLVRGYENDTDATDGNGFPPHSIAFVVEGGDDQAIAEEIRRRKTGCGTYGNTSVVVVDSYGVTRTIKFSRSVLVPVSGIVTVRARAGYTDAIKEQIQIAMSARVTDAGIGDGLEIEDAVLPARLNGSVDNKKYQLVSVAIARDGGTPAAETISVAYNERLTAQPSDFQIVVVP